MLIPESGKPADLKVNEIKTVSDADRVLLWLGDTLKDMQTQVNDRGVESDPIWAKRLRAAERNTRNLRHRVLELRDSLADSSSVHEAIIATLFKQAPEGVLEGLKAQVEIDYPHLAGFDLNQVAS